MGLDAAFARSSFRFAAGFLVVADTRPRRLTPGLTRRLADAAVLAEPLLARAAGRPAPLPRARRLHAAIRPRAAAQRLVEAAIRSGAADGPAGLMMLDLDRFRAVNEALGIAAGDALLAVTGTRLEQALDSATGLLLRLEGDRFVIVSPRDPAGAARRWRAGCSQAVSQPLVLDGRTVVMQASIGIVAGRRRRRPDPAAADRRPTPRSAAPRSRAAAASCCTSRPRTRWRSSAAGSSSTSPTPLGNGQMHLAYQPYVDLARRPGQRRRGAAALAPPDCAASCSPAAFIAARRGHRHDPAARPLGAPRPRWPRAARWPARLGARGQHLAAAVPPAGLPRRRRRRAGRDRLPARAARARDHRDRADARQPRDHRASSAR